MDLFPRFTIRSTLLIVLTLFCISCIIAITYFSYSDTSNTILTSFEREVNASENLFSQSSIYIHRGLRLWDSGFNKPLMKNLDVFLAAYEESGNNPENMSLPDVITRMDPLYQDITDLYLINQSAVIAYTTDPIQLGMDMGVWDDFYPRFLEILESDEFVSDEVVRGFNPNSPLRKYVYHSTPDHRYVAQIGLNVENESVYERSTLSYRSLVTYVMNLNQDLQDLHVISSMNAVVIGKNAYRHGTLDMESRNITREVFRSRERFIIRDAKNQSVTTYLFIPNSVDNSPSSPYMNLVAKFIFSTKDLDQQLTYNLLVHLVLAFVASFFAILLAWLVTLRITSPINQLVQEIDVIADGALDQTISQTSHPELKRISQSVQSMVHQITGTIRDLQVSESRYRGLFNTATDGILILDNDEIVDANPAAQQIFTISDSMIGMKLSTLCPPVWEYIKNPRCTSPVSSACPGSPSCNAGPGDTCEADIRSGSGVYGPRYLNIRMVPLTYDSRPLVQVQIRDITRRVELENKLHQLNADLEHQVEERTATLKATISDLDSFTYTVSHDLRAPLRAIDGNTYLLQKRVESMISPEMLRYLEKIRTNIKVMDHLIDDLLNFSRMSRKPIAKEHIDMNQLMQEVTGDLASEPMSLPYVLESALLPPAEGDYRLIRQVLINLLSNAVKFGKPGVCNHISVYSDSADGRTWYHIKDTGIGFDMRYADRIFEVFLQLHPSSSEEGTGVGLAIVKRIITRHRGEIRVQSEEGVGSIFSFTLQPGPLSDSDAE